MSGLGASERQQRIPNRKQHENALCALPKEPRAREGKSDRTQVAACSERVTYFLNKRHGKAIGN
jgi:hypothetical protein